MQCELNLRLLSKPDRTGTAEGSRNYTRILFADGRVPEVFGKTAQYHLRKGDVARLITGTGGGYGDPLERSVEQAERLYGVVLKAGTLEVEWLVSGHKEFG